MWFFRFAHGQHKCNFHKCLLTWKKHKNKSLAKTNHMVADIIATYHSLVPRLLPCLSAGEEPGYEVNLPSYLSCVFEHWFLVASQMSICSQKQQITIFLLPVDSGMNTASQPFTKFTTTSRCTLCSHVDLQLL